MNDMNDADPQEQGKRVGLHPAIVIFGVIIGLWLFIQAIIPKSKDIHPPQGNEGRSEHLALLLKEAESVPVPSMKVTAQVEGMNALSLLVPQQTTDSQIVALLNHLRRSRMEGSLASQIPALPVNLPQAKEIIDILRILEEKTKGNLTEEETNVMRDMLYTLQMKYVELASGSP